MLNIEKLLSGLLKITYGIVFNWVIFCKFNYKNGQKYYQNNAESA